jgi:uncharacterized protein DUF4236
VGLYLRKSVRLGPLRLNLSSYGVGLSVGVKGARFGVDASGHPYTHLGRHGIYWRKRFPLPAPRTLQPPLGPPPLETHHRVHWGWLLLLLAALGWGVWHVTH